MQKQLQLVDLPMKKTLARSEHEAFRVDPEMKSELNTLRHQGVAVSEWMYRIVRRALSDLKENGMKLK